MFISNFILRISFIPSNSFGLGDFSVSPTILTTSVKPRTNFYEPNPANSKIRSRIKLTESDSHQVRNWNDWQDQVAYQRQSQWKTSRDSTYLPCHRYHKCKDKHQGNPCDHCNMHPFETPNGIRQFLPGIGLFQFLVVNRLEMLKQITFGVASHCISIDNKWHKSAHEMCVLNTPKNTTNITVQTEFSTTATRKESLFQQCR